MHIKADDLKSKLFFRALKVNAGFSGFSGLGLILFHNPLSQLLGSVPPTALLIIGLSLVSFSIRLIYVNWKREIKRGEAWSIAISDALWVVGSVGIVFAMPTLFNLMGQWIVLAVALIVLALADIQFYGLWKIRRA